MLKFNFGPAIELGIASCPRFGGISEHSSGLAAMERGQPLRFLECDSNGLPQSARNWAGALLDSALSSSKRLNHLIYTLRLEETSELLHLFGGSSFFGVIFYYAGRILYPESEGRLLLERRRGSCDFSGEGPSLLASGGVAIGAGFLSSKKTMKIKFPSTSLHRLRED